MRQPYHALREYPWQGRAPRAPAAGFSAALSRDGARPWSRARPARKAARGARLCSRITATARAGPRPGWPFRTRLAHGRQCRPDQGGGRGIIEAGDRQVPRHRQPEPLRRRQHAQGHVVVRCEHSGVMQRAAQQLVRSLAAGVERKEPCWMSWVSGCRPCAQRVQVALVAVGAGDLVGRPLMKKAMRS